MRKLPVVLVLIGSMIAAHVAAAAERSAIFTVENMTCASCPYIVKTSMEAVPGVTGVSVSFKAKAATVTFDDAKATADAIAAASAKSGLPATLKELR